MRWAPAGEGVWFVVALALPQGWGSWNGDAAARTLRWSLTGAVACDERSWSAATPRDVTSAWSNAEGSICSQRSDLTRPKDFPRGSPKGFSRLRHRCEREHTT